MNAFLDANVFFAAARSPKGGSSFVLALGKSGAINIITTEYVLIEAERNIRESPNQMYLVRHYQNLSETHVMVQPLPKLSASSSALLEQYIPKKDMPVLVGAIESKANVFITLDRKHFLENEKLLVLRLPFKIMNPQRFLQKYFG
jgi:predicted nucleic acid-binding protein